MSLNLNFQIKNLFFISLLFWNTNFLLGQNPGDTIKVNILDYNTSIRDTLVHFPDDNLSFEKIIMKYNMRCKKGLVSTGAERNKGCGEWDYSCNTFIVDSSKIEIVNSKHQKYIISGLSDPLESGDMVDFTAKPIHDYYSYEQSEVILNNVINEEIFNLSVGNTPNLVCLDGSQVSGKSHFLYTATELLSAGMTAGMIDGISLNVANSGGDINFFNIGIKHYTDNELDLSNPETTDFTTVHNSNYTFKNGINTIPFLTSFEWDGSQNLLFEFSFTNTESQNNISLLSADVASTVSIYANNNYAIDFSQGGYIDIEPSNLASIQKELTVSFWTYGDEDVMPVNTSIIWANAENKAQRELNIHLPWSDGSVYFDCGFDGGFDRISKIASPWSYKGRWTHWAFTKNANTGSMKMYINGSPFTQTTGKFNDINFLEMILGADYRHLLNYKGKINEFRVWDVALDKDDIKNWINKSIDNTHPQYDHLVAYYPLQEGNDLIIQDLKNNTSSNGTNILWSYERGNQLKRGFKIATSRPQMNLWRGSYDLSVQSKTVIDSVLRNPSTINAYSIISNQGTTQHDIVNLDTSYYLYKTDPAVLYDAATGAALESFPIVSELTLTMEELDYLSRFPYYNEIVSFVTPYGIGLDLGINGKTWLFDVSDFAPILKGDKGFKITMGGQYQEEFDIEFWFIVGTPPRDVLAFDQLWQGSNRLGSANIYNLYDEETINPVDVNILPGGETFKIRSTITGHGSDGEFEQNGGSVFHSLFINDSEEFFWLINKECSENPIYPQGGTWVIDRQGWCPGERSLLKEFNATEFITPGSTTKFDYAISKASKAGGDYRYLMAHQLITYGAANHTLDASVKEVLIPSKNILYARLNPVCVNPSIVIQNTGSDELTSVNIEYWINNNSEKEHFEWTGNLDFMESETVDLPAGNLYVNANSIDNTFHVSVLNPNKGTDEYLPNNRYHSDFIQADALPDEFIIEVKTNSRSFENNYTIRDDNGDIVMTNALSGNNKLFRDTIRLNGCYKFELIDNGNDGLDWWANPSQGKGFVKIKNLNGNTLVTFNPDFGGKLNYGFSTKSISYVEKTKQWDSGIVLSPNPSTGVFALEGNLMKHLDISLYSIIGTQVAHPSIQEEEYVQFDVSHLANGIYIVSIVNGEKIMTKKINILN